MTGQHPLSCKNEIDVEDLRSEKIISFFRQNLSYGERYFAEKFEEHDLTDNVAYTCDDTFSPVCRPWHRLREGPAVHSRVGE